SPLRWTPLLLQTTVRSHMPAGNRAYSGHTTSTCSDRASNFAAVTQSYLTRCADLKPEDQLMSKVKGKVAVITGGSSGIGLATAQRFANEGAHVYITGRRQAELDKAVTAIGSAVTAVKGDVSNLEDLDVLYRKIAADRCKVDIVVA